MQKLTKNRMVGGAMCELRRIHRWHAYGLCDLALIAIVATTIMLSACGSSGASGDTPQSAVLLGNWQFTMAPQTDGISGDPTFSGGLQGGFLLENNTSVTGQLAYSITSSTSSTGPCNSGSGPVTVIVSGQSVTITEVAASQTYTLTGTLSADGTTMMGTYASTAGTAADGSACGYVETGLSWGAVSVPPVTGTVQGFFHSTAGLPLTNQDFVLSGSLTQGANIGASNATVTGMLTFEDPLSEVSDYPCLPLVLVNGEISGNALVLQLIATNGSAVGQIGGITSGMSPVTVNSTPNGNVIDDAVSPGYAVNTKVCSGTGLGVQAGDYGNICLALNSTTGCQQPITLSPASITFPAKLLDTASSTQTVTLTDVSGQELDNLSLSELYQTGIFTGQTDFTGQPNFTFTDNCGAGGVPSNGNNFSLGGSAPTSCVISSTFIPQESCTWLPYVVPPAQCPAPLMATITVTSPASADNNTSFSVPITGLGLSALQPSTPELDFGAEEQLSPPEASLPQMLSFTNMSANPVQILGRAPCLYRAKGQNTLPRPLTATSPIAGLQVVANGSGILPINPDNNTIQYNCDSDPGTMLPNFQISSDTCTGTLLASLASCSVEVAYVPQPNTNVSGGLDYFLELNTVQCADPVNDPPAPSNPCEIDSGRFPVELKANYPSPLRMIPSAGLDFGDQKHGSASAPLSITLLNDPNLTTTQAATFVGRILVQGNYAEMDDCPATLAPGSSCTLSVTFSPSGVGFESGTLTINYSPEPTGQPQFVYLHGTGQ